MFSYFVVFCAGLMVGWNALKQPAWAEAAYNRFMAWVRSDG